MVGANREAAAGLPEVWGGMERITSADADLAVGWTVMACRCGLRLENGSR
jgi:hypothetical protein